LAAQLLVIKIDVRTVCNMRITRRDQIVVLCVELVGALGFGLIGQSMLATLFLFGSLVSIATLVKRTPR
jgi:hypothetical protein